MTVPFVFGPGVGMVDHGQIDANFAATVGLDSSGNVIISGTLGVSGVTTHNALVHMVQPAAIQFDGTRTWSGTQQAIGNAEIYSFTNQTGTTTTGNPVSFHHFSVASDTLQSTNAVANIRSDLTTGTGITGGRNALWSTLSIGGTPGTAGQYSAGTFAASANAPSNAGGNILYGGNPTAGLNALATGSWEIVGEEVDVRAVTGSTPTRISGVSIVMVTGHAVHGSSNQDSAIVIGNFPAATTGWDYVLRIGGPGNPFPVVSTGTLIATWSGITGLNAAIGIDFSSMTFSQTPLKMPLMTNAVNDAAAATASVPVGGFYRNGSIVMQRAA